jgi:copper chaperone
LISSSTTKIAEAMATLTVEVRTVTLKVVMHCEGCAGSVKRAVKRIRGVISYTIDFPGQKVTITGDVQPDDVLKKVSKSGKITSFWPEEPKVEEPPKVEEVKEEEKKEEEKAPEEPEKKEEEAEKKPEEEKKEEETPPPPAEPPAEEKKEETPPPAEPPAEEKKEEEAAAAPKEEEKKEDSEAKPEVQIV